MAEGPSGEPLRVAIRLCPEPAAWQRSCVESLVGLATVRLVACLTDAPPAAGLIPPDIPRLGADDRQGLARLAPDVLLDLASAGPDPELATLTRHGRWAFAHRSGAALADLGTEEVLRGRRAVPVRLIRSGPGPGEVRLLEEGCFKAVRHSLAATRARIGAAIAAWPRRHLVRLARDPAPPPLVEPWPESGTPARLRPLLVPLAQLRNLIGRLAEEAIEEHWRIGIIDRPLETLLDGFDPASIRWLPQPPDGYWADPFGLIEEGRRFVFAEAYPFAAARGHVVVLEIEGPDRPRVVHEFRLPDHLSYPQPVRHDGDLFCLPECHGRGELRLYRAAPFPHRWVPDRALLAGFAAVDPTVFEHAGRWWLFCGNHADQDETKLYVFHAPALFGPWQAHAENPVKCDLRSSRPAGPPFVRDGRLYRPAQDCSRTYGGAITINRIDGLEPDRFAEEVVAVLRPDPAGPCPHGMHTLTRLGDATLIDGKRHRRSLGRFVAGLRRLWQEAGAPSD